MLRVSPVGWRRDERRPVARQLDLHPRVAHRPGRRPVDPAVPQRLAEVDDHRSGRAGGRPQPQVAERHAPEVDLHDSGREGADGRGPLVDEPHRGGGGRRPEGKAEAGRDQGPGRHGSARYASAFSSAVRKVQNRGTVST